MASYNKVILMGNLTRKPEVRYLSNGNAVCKFGLAVNRRFKDAQGEWKEEATFVDVTFFGKRGEAFAKYHDKGKTAFIEGSLRLDQWDDKQSGEKRSKLYVVGDDWQFVGAGAGGAAGAREGGGGGDDGPGGYAGGYSGGATGSGGHAPEQPPVDVDDTPF
ncbi:MAG: single-stranded DNA-binding protein [Planctomycetes bacterium]|nr:single-stranded DNA-binding protein [Planctomycetota bacterium]